MKMLGAGGVSLSLSSRKKKLDQTPYIYLYMPHTLSIYVPQLLACGVVQLNATRTVWFPICPQFLSLFPDRISQVFTNVSVWSALTPMPLHSSIIMLLPLNFGGLLSYHQGVGSAIDWPLPTGLC